MEKTAEQNNVDLPEENQINKKALKDFAAYANDLKNQGKFDLNKPFEIIIEAQLDEKGKLINPVFKKKEGDENLVELFGRMVSALNDSGFLTYLSPISKNNPNSTVRIMVKQGEKDVLVLVGADHLGGDAGLLKLLREAGFATERLYGVDAQRESCCPP